MSEKRVKTRVVHKHDLEVNWIKAKSFIPLRGELIIYDTEVDENGNALELPEGRIEPYGFERFKIGDGVVQADGTVKGTKVTDLPFTINPHTHDEKANIADLKITGTVTKALGGIAKDKVYTDADIADVLSDLLFPYVAPTFNSITLSAAAGTFEYGTVKTVSKVTPNFTKGSKAITSITIGTTSGGSDLYSGNTVTSGTAITLSSSKTYDGNTGGTIYCTISDGEQSKSASAEISYSYYTYYAVTDTIDAPTSWTAVGSTSTTGIEIVANKGQYIWIASTQDFDVTAKTDPKQQNGICQLNELSGKYNSAANTLKTSSQTLVNSKNYTCTGVYNFYRLGAPRAADTKAKFKLGKGD